MSAVVVVVLNKAVVGQYPAVRIHLELIREPSQRKPIIRLLVIRENMKILTNVFVYLRFEPSTGTSQDNFVISYDLIERGEESDCGTAEQT